MLTFIDFIATFSPLINGVISIHGGMYEVSWAENINFFAFRISLSHADNFIFGADVVSGLCRFVYDDPRFTCRDMYLTVVDNHPCLISIFDK